MQIMGEEIILHLRRLVRIRSWWAWTVKKEACTLKIQDQAVPTVSCKSFLPIRRQMSIHPLQKDWRHNPEKPEWRGLHAERPWSDKVRIKLSTNDSRERGVPEAKTNFITKPFHKWIQPSVQGCGQKTTNLPSDHLRTATLTPGKLFKRSWSLRCHGAVGDTDCARSRLPVRPILVQWFKLSVWSLQQRIMTFPYYWIFKQFILSPITQFIFHFLIYR